ncbi:peptidogalycan biosysnthesis protein [Flavobacterium sp.]|uniref:peptidogalycan biosysnthesis protein n=1 Tax=Flavobacterium sp. TaxID=239 RepID=UPI0025F335D4|nr:peptidogalycan biosysnthesis protein [Flavobacterium sp.]
METFTYKIYASLSELPTSWDEVAVENAFLQTPYLKVLEDSSPINMRCYYIGIYENDILIGVALTQYLDINKLESFGERDQCIKTYIRNFIFKNFSGHVLFLGNNLVSGHNSYAYKKHLSFETISKIMLEYCAEMLVFLKQKNITIHLITFKDFYQIEATELKKFDFKNIYEIHAQPNMILNLNTKWKSKEDYNRELTKKYRDQYKRARKKFTGIAIEELSLEKIEQNEAKIYEFYKFVAKNASFNTFILSESHFSTFKKKCPKHFKLFGYFDNHLLVGFHTIFQNGDTLETYFLGYDEKVQKEKMLYLNMLYNMTEFGIENHFKRIIFGRTALEIKSSIGAQPIMMSGFMFHKNRWINKLLPKIFPRLEPEMIWQQRHPFKEN